MSVFLIIFFNCFLDFEIMERFMQASEIKVQCREKKVVLL